MRTFLVQRMLLALPNLLGVFTIVFFLIHLIPGDPVDLILGESALPSSRREVRTLLGLDQPLFTQYVHALGGALSGDLRASFIDGRPVLTLILEALPFTVVLALVALLISIAVAVPLGILSALYRDSLLDFSALTVALLGISIPSFWGGPLLMILFSVWLGWFPLSGAESVLSIVLPALTLGLGLTGITTRMMRSSMIETLSADYLVTARAKGVSEPWVVINHGARNALLSVVTILGLQLGALLAGAVITETIFAWPGVGRLLTQAIFMRDIPVVQGCLLVIATLYIGVNLITDLVYGVIDPRVREGLSA